MRIPIGICMVAATFLPAAISAQQLDAVQREVWEFEQQCWRDNASRNMEAFKTCFHPDYVGWNAADPTPMPFDEGVAAYFMESSPARVYTMKPHHILITGNVAVVHFSAFVVRVGPDGRDQQAWEHWTDIAVKENGRWSWIADHGHAESVGT